MQIVFLDLGSVDHQDLDLASLQQGIPWTCYQNSNTAQVRERVALAEVIVTNKVAIDAATMDAAPALKLICAAATGTNHIDLAAARARGITVCNVQGYATASVVQHVFCLMLMLMRSLPSYQHAVQLGDWHRSEQFCLLDYPIDELSGKTLGIIGYGELGKQVEQVARVFGMHVIIAQRLHAPAIPDRVSLPSLLQQSDVISLHCPLTEQTRGLLGKQQLELLKPSAILINTARGGIVDESALLDMLQHNRLRGAAFDVLATEPPQHNSPLLSVTLPNLLVTPHIAWASRQARQRLLQEVHMNIVAYTQGTPRNRVN